MEFEDNNGRISLFSDLKKEILPTTTVQNSDLVFGQKHNGIECALCPTAKRACDRAWVIAKQVEIWSGMTNRTLYNRLSELEEYQRIPRLQDFANVEMARSS